MPESGEGLPSPAPGPRSRSPSHPVPDLPKGTVHRNLESLRSLSELHTGPWKGAIDTRTAIGAGDPSFVPFTGEGADALGEVQSAFEHAVLGDKLDTGYTGVLRAALGAPFQAATSPIATITDEYQVARIRELQKQFLQNNGPTLIRLSEKLAKAKRAIREMAGLMDPAPVHPRAIGDLLEKKSRVGDRTLQEIESALAHATDPAERKRLKSLEDDLTGWMAQRDERVKREYQEAGGLEGRLSGLEAQMFRQRDVLRKAAWSESPSTLTRAGTDPPEVLSTTHVRPDATLHVASLKDLLLNSKVGLDQHLEP